MKFPVAILSLSCLLVACTPKPMSADVATPAAATPAEVSNKLPSGSVTPTAKRAAGHEGVEPLQIFRAFGTEPFWNINVVGTTLTFMTPDDPTGMAMQGTRHPVDGGLDIVGIAPGGHEFVLKVRQGVCSDGMSDNHYEMTSTFQMGGPNYTGCGEVAK